MTARQANELLYDSEAALRLVDSAIEDIRDARLREPGADADAASGARLRALIANGPLGFIGVPQLLERCRAEIVSVLGSLRESRSVLERAAVAKIQNTSERLREVTHATKMAATDILDGLDRAVALVNEMDRKAEDGDAAAGAELRSKLRDELFSLVGCMQFQDITTQQLSYASSVLKEMETRLAGLATILDPATLGASASTPSAPPEPAAAFDPSASVQNAEARQAMADQIVAGVRK